MSTSTQIHIQRALRTPITAGATNPPTLSILPIAIKSRVPHRSKPISITHTGRCAGIGMRTTQSLTLPLLGAVFVLSLVTVSLVTIGLGVRVLSTTAMAAVTEILGRVVRTSIESAVGFERGHERGFEETVVAFEGFETSFENTE